VAGARVVVDELEHFGQAACEILKRGWCGMLSVGVGSNRDVQFVSVQSAFELKGFVVLCFGWGWIVSYDSIKFSRNVTGRSMNDSNASSCSGFLSAAYTSVCRIVSGEPCTSSSLSSSSFPFTISRTSRPLLQKS